MLIAILPNVTATMSLANQTGQAMQIIHICLPAEDMRGLVLTSRDDNVVECELLREENDGVFGYPIIFVKDKDGNWWIQEL